MNTECDTGASPWTHRICVPCWNMKNPDRAVQESDYQESDPGLCCYCGNETRSGIYVRDDPRAVHG